MRNISEFSLKLFASISVTPSFEDR